MNSYTEISAIDIDWTVNRKKVLTVKAAESVLSNLKEDSGTGPDLLPARILKKCATVLALPVYLLTWAILREGSWPKTWGKHWVAAIYKKKSVYDPNNYRGVHMTAQLAKVIERLLGLIFVPVLTKEISIGPNQFAYTKARGSRDALAYLMLTWIQGFKEKARFALYMSDVSGAFDRVFMERMMIKLHARKVPEDILSVLRSWLEARWAEVVVGGYKSLRYMLQNMVFQGTVWGPILWNVFYEDARKAIRACSFTEIVFADDLNAFRKYDAAVNNNIILTDMDSCQKNLHAWGNANCVLFDKGKEGAKILSRRRPHGSSFTLLGIGFDCSLVMSDSVADLAKESKWKLSAILRTKRFNTGTQLVALYKTQLLPYIEYRTAAIYHACSGSLAALDIVQDRLLAVAGLSDVEALRTCKLAPLAARRDMAMLGLIHRTILGKGPEHFRKFFVLNPQECNGGAKHRLQVKESVEHASDFCLPGSRPAEYIENSALGLIKVYSKLPAQVVESSATVATFQCALQALLLDRAENGHQDWKMLHGPRWRSSAHPLNSLR